MTEVTEKDLITAVEEVNPQCRINASTESPKMKDNDTRDSSKVDGRPTDPFEVPDGGTKAWLCVFGGFMISITCYGVANTFGVFEEYYSANQLSNESLNNISWIGSLQLCLILLYLLSQGIGVGLAQGLLFTPGMAVLAHHFKRYRTLVFGIFAAGASIGGVILPIALQRLFDKVGFAWGVRILAFIVLVCVGTGFICCTTRFPPRKGGRVLDIRVFKTPSYTLLVLGAGFVGLGLYAPVNFGVVYATDHGMSQQLAFYSLAILNAGSLFGRILPNVLATMFGPLNLLIGSCTVSSVSLYVWFTATRNAGMLAFQAIYGITSGAYVSCLPAATASLTKNPNETGLRLGMMFFSTSFFWLVSSPIQGALIGIDGSYWSICVLSGSTVILGVCFMLLSRFSVRKEKATWKV
ncbi:major facilitator superfamily domain-containing protein [Lentinula guzmanii]|uniref:Major facilitator superfamily domain-containing protein n=1 Tax=Lentinula guzmanii TaxID=2804957 RepID=A0AA38MW75_9AGAR|nr:major facilitator superfamily domain-containing protein [Lentinula guzmanii]